jgi:transposase-like protein
MYTGLRVSQFSATNRSIFSKSPNFVQRDSWNHYARPVGDSWRVDETYIKVKGQWVYLYRCRR